MRTKCALNAHRPESPGNVRRVNVQKIHYSTTRVQVDSLNEFRPGAPKLLRKGLDRPRETVVSTRQTTPHFF